MYDLLVMQGMTEQQKMVFLSEISRVRKDATVAVLLALFLGGLGAHQFYMGRIGLGILYLVFCWTFIPSLIALIECFFLPGRVRNYNHEQSMLVAMQVRAAFPH